MGLIDFVTLDKDVYYRERDALILGLVSYFDNCYYFFRIAVRW